MKRRTFLAGACLIAVLFLSFGPAASGEETHACTEIYASCLGLILSSNLSLRGAYDGIQTCIAMFAACMVVFCL